MKKIYKRYIQKDRQKDIFGEKNEIVQGFHRAASKQYIRLLPVLFKILGARLTKKIYGFNDGLLDELLISVDPEQGRFLYNLVLVNKPKTILEFGLSHGISAIYISQALDKLSRLDINAKLYCCEMIDFKIESSQANLKKMELENYVNIVKGDILGNYDILPDNIDFVHMDGFPNINLEVLKLIEPKLSKNALIVTDDVNLFNYEMKNYLDYLYSSDLYSNTKLNISDGVLLSVKY